MSPSPTPDSADLAFRYAWLKTQLNAPVSLVWTDNRSSIVSVKGSTISGYQLRVHHMFRQAPEVIWQALVAYVRGTDRTAQQTLRAYINCQQYLIRTPPSRQPRTQPLQTQGRYFDLETIYHELNRTYFSNQVQARTTWARRPPQRPRTSIRFGSYNAKQRLIRIHRLLDQDFVPRYFIESVIFHEMLHQLIPRQRINGRWSIHPPAFRQAEQRFQHYKKAQQWQRQYLKRLLCE